jgi:hypothetical protein
VPDPAAAAVPLGREFTLALGQSVAVAGTDLCLTLRAVRDDSRCPADVQCMWAGDATVALEVGGAATFDLHTSGALAREATHGGYRITLVRLDPVPHSTAPLTADYRATLVVVR